MAKDKLTSLAHGGSPQTEFNAVPGRGSTSCIAHFTRRSAKPSQNSLKSLQARRSRTESARRGGYKTRIHPHATPDGSLLHEPQTLRVPQTPIELPVAEIFEELSGISID
jgi:hypothetical protein